MTSWGRGEYQPPVTLTPALADPFARDDGWLGSVLRICACSQLLVYQIAQYTAHPGQRPWYTAIWPD